MTLLFLAPMYSFDPERYAQMAVTAANGGMPGWQSGWATRFGRFQFVLGRELGVVAYGLSTSSRSIPSCRSSNAIEHVMLDQIYALTGSADRELLIVNAYIIPGDRAIASLRELRQRGVVTKVLTNSLASQTTFACQGGGPPRETRPASPSTSLPWTATRARSSCSRIPRV